MTRRIIVRGLNADLAIAAAETAATAAQTAETNAETAQAAAEAARDGAVAIAGPVDATVEALLKNTGGVGPLSNAALSATIAAHGGAAWVTGTAYKRGRVIVNPSGAVVIANVDHTAAASYATDSAKWDAVSALDFALAPDNGKRPVGKGELVLVPEDFGAVGDWNGTTGTDDTTAFAAMFTFMDSAAGTGAYIQLTRGKNYKVNGLTPFVGLKIVGCGPDASLTCTSGDMFSFSGTLYNMHFESVRFYSHTAGGHLFAFATDTGVSNLKFNHCIFVVINPDKSVVNGPNIGAFIENSFMDCETTLSGNSHTVPAFNLKSNNGGLNLNQWVRGRFTYTGNYAIWLESINTSNYCYDNLIQDVNFEICNGGCVKILSGNNTRIIGAVVYDLVGATTKDLFHVGKTAGGLKSKYTTIKNVQRRGGTLGGGLQDIAIAGAGGAFTTVTDCDTGTGSGFSIYWAYEAGYFRGGTGITHTGDDGVFKQIYGEELIQEKLLATVTGIDAKTVAVTNLYTVPTGKKCVITKIVVRNTTASSITVVPTVGAGSDASGVNTFAAASLTGLVNTTTAGAWVMEGTGLRPIVPAAGVVKLGITVGSTATTHTIAVDVYGYTYI